MEWSRILWIGNGVIWCIVILGFISLVIFNRARNRKRRDDDD